jgi:hypothetical protein
MFRNVCWQLVTDCQDNILFLEDLDSLTIEKRIDYLHRNVGKQLPTYRRRNNPDSEDNN